MGDELSDRLARCHLRSLDACREGRDAPLRRTRGGARQLRRGLGSTPTSAGDRGGEGHQLNWAGGTHTAMPTVIIANAWAGIPIISIILLAGLLSLPKEPVEAAKIDGASELRILAHVTLPALRPVLAFAALFQMVNLFREFAEFAIITGGGPGLATSVLNYYVYQTTFVFGELGLGAALAVLLVFMMAIPLLVIFKLSKRGSAPKWAS